MTERRPRVIAGNWKMNTTLDEAIELVNEMRYELDEIESVEKIVCPPFISLAKLKELLSGSSVKVGAQDVFYEDKGAFTGEISPLMLSDLCQYVIIGHSERRQYFNETDDIVNRKLKSAMRHGLKPILCVGENLEQNQSGNTESIIRDQMTKGLADLESPNFLIAYEPIWAIGTGRAATGEHANRVMSFIRSIFSDLFSPEAAETLPLLYGGSVNAENIIEYLSQPDIDGALVGGASLKAAQFVSIVKRAAQPYSL
ncbi:triose-phosphate isomerase [Dehalogenimonas sp. THU2]|uniref:triose-phosphate isomerase n=1 Tax=Dehalogenimonas sp. THU2 TaxID=3151121 RepID=UPI003218D3CB